MTIYLILKSFRKHLSRNISIIIELILGSLIMLLALAAYNGNFNMYNQTKKVIEPNVVKIWVDNNNSHLDNSIKNSDHITADESKNLSYKIVKEKPQVEKIGESNYNILGYDDKTREMQGILNCSAPEVCVASCNRELTEMFNFKVKEGIDFSTYFKSSNSASYIPLIISKKLGKENAIGSIVDIPYLQDGIANHRKFKIIGVIDESYPTLFQVNNLYDPYIPFDGYYCFAGSLINNNFSDVYAKLKEGTNIQDVSLDWNNSLGKYKKFEITNLNQMAKNTLLDVSYQMKYVCYGVIILILSAFGIISSVLFSILKRKKEFGARIAVGATKKDIIKLITGEIGVLFLISQPLSILIALLVCSRDKSYLLNWETVGICLLIILILAIISIVPAIIRVFKMKPVELIHERR